MKQIKYDVAINVGRLVRLIKREGTAAALRKGWPYLTRRVADEIRLRNIVKTQSVEERFTKIYHWNFWRAKESASGPGSSVRDTENLRRHLPTMFEEFRIERVLDAPCGDFRWMQLLMKDSAITYVGGDIVQPMIQKNAETHGSDRIRFVHLDITQDPLPQADLWFCRDCFYHLALPDIFAALQRFAESDIPYMFASHVSTPTGPHNHDIVSGDFRQVALFEPPFSFPREVLYRIDDFATGTKSSREMCLWTRQQVADVLRATSARKNLLA